MNKLKVVALIDDKNNPCSKITIFAFCFFGKEIYFKQIPRVTYSDDTIETHSFKNITLKEYQIFNALFSDSKYIFDFNANGVRLGIFALGYLDVSFNTKDLLKKIPLSLKVELKRG